MKEDFKVLFEYNNHVNQKLIALISEHFENVPEKTLKLINHLVDAHQIWNARILKKEEFEVWQLNDWAIIAQLDIQNHENTLKIITENNVDNAIEYSNSKGAKFSHKIKDILFHIVNHSTYHRAQIATELKNHGIEPLKTDYILYKRAH